jgi:hypothetical protein
MADQADAMGNLTALLNAQAQPPQDPNQQAQVPPTSVMRPGLDGFTPGHVTLDQHARNAQLQLRARVVRSLLGLWPMLDMERLDATFPTWALSAGQLILDQHSASSSLAAQYLTAARYVAGVPGSPIIVPASPLPAEQIARSLRTTSVIAVKQAMTAGQTITQASANAFVLSSGAASRLVLNGGRDTVVQSVKADPRARGYQRVTSGKPCEYCASKSV